MLALQEAEILKMITVTQNVNFRTAAGIMG